MLRPALLLLTVLAGCAVERPPALACPALTARGGQTVMASQGPSVAPPATVAAVEAETAEAMRDAIRSEARGTPRGAPVTVRIVSLSAGGQYGAFGAGFLTGWVENPVMPRPVFDVVTGVSAGAIIAPVIFAGREFGGALLFYRGLSTDQVLRRRALPATLAAPSIATPAPLESFLLRELTPALLSAVAARHAAGDRLLISATNLDTGAGEILDIGAAAGAPNARACIAEAMLASAAIPGLLPPRNIGGALYADGGLRDQVFFQAVDTARARVARETGRTVRVEAYLVVNGALRPPVEPAEDRLLGYLNRSVEILADEVLRSSILEAVRFAEDRPDWRLRGIVSQATFGTCGIAAPPAGTFDPCVTRVLFDEGRAAGRATPIDWLDARALRRSAEEL